MDDYRKKSTYTEIQIHGKWSKQLQTHDLSPLDME